MSHIKVFGIEKVINTRKCPKQDVHWKIQNRKLV